VSEVGVAFDHLGEGHAPGKVVFRI
jgi:hypothetical protein